MYENVQLINASAYRPLSAFKPWKITAVLRHDKSSAARLYPSANDALFKQTNFASFKDVIDLICLECRQRPTGRYVDALTSYDPSTEHAPRASYWVVLVAYWPTNDPSSLNLPKSMSAEYSFRLAPPSSSLSRLPVLSSVARLPCISDLHITSGRSRNCWYRASHSPLSHPTLHFLPLSGPVNPASGSGSAL